MILSGTQALASVLASTCPWVLASVLEIDLEWVLAILGDMVTEWDIMIRSTLPITDTVIIDQS